jgi:hypothetical protein
LVVWYIESTGDFLSAFNSTASRSCLLFIVPPNHINPRPTDNPPDNQEY